MVACPGHIDGVQEWTSSPDNSIRGQHTQTAEEWESLLGYTNFQCIFIENIFFCAVRIQGPLAHHVGIEVTPKFIGDVRTVPASTSRPGPYAIEQWIIFHIVQATGRSILLCLFKTIDYCICHIVRISSFSFILTLALYLHYLFVLAQCDCFVEMESPEIVSIGMLDSHIEIGMWCYLFGNG